jgi:glycosyltransferase involved in cell wall biosynthesis
LHVWILADVSRDVPGGMLRHMQLHAEGLRRVGERATLFFSEDIAQENGVRHGLSRLPGVRSFAALRARLLDEAPDVVNVHTQCAPAWISARRLGLHSSRVVVMSYSADEPQVRLRRPRDGLRWARAAIPARLTLPHADGVWCVNQQDLEYYVAEYGVARERVVRFPHAVGDGFYAAHADARRDPLQVLFVGTWIARKGIDVLRDAFARLVRARPDVRIVLAGTLVGEATVRAALDESVLARTRILDSASDTELALLYRTSGLLVLPSYREGLPIVMLEAMACGCPPLAAANSGMLDVIESGENGWLETSFDPVRWSARILELLERPDALERASRGATTFAERFRIEPLARSVAAWYRAL